MCGTKVSVDHFLLRGPRARTFFTTRNKYIAFAFVIEPIDLGVFRREESLALLRRALKERNRPTAINDAALHMIATRLGDHPQAIKLAAGQLLAGTAPHVWLQDFEGLGLEDVNEFANRADPGRNLTVCFNLSVNQLTDFQRRQYEALGVFPPATRIPISVIARLWRQIEPMPAGHVRRLLDDLAHYCLLDLIPGESVSVHSLLRDYLRIELGERLQIVQSHLLYSYRPLGSRWPAIPDDGYLHNHLAYHLRDAGRDDELRELLFDFDWLSGRLRGSGLAGLLGDFKFLREDRELRLLETAIRLSQNAFAADRRQLAGQLLGRLSPEFGAGIAALLERARAELGVWLRPFVSSLNSPDGTLRQTLQGHADGVAAVAVSSDNRFLVSGSDDGTVKFWDLPSGAEQITLAGHRSGVKAVAVSRTHAISGSDDGSVKLWKLDSGEESHSFDGHGPGVKAVAFTPDSTQALVGYDDGVVGVWDVSSRNVRKRLVHTAPVRALCVTANGTQVVSGSEDGTVKVWDLAGEGEFRTIRIEPPAAVSDVALIGSDYVVSASWDRTVRISNLADATEHRILRGHTNGVTCLAISTDGSRAVSGSGDDTLKVWSLSDGTEIGPPLIGHTAWVRDVALAESDRTVVSASDDGTIRLWDIARRPVIDARSRHRGWVTGLALYADTRRAISASADGTLKVWDTYTGSELHALDAGAAGRAYRVTSVVLCSDGRAVCGSDDHTLQIWNVEGGICERTLKGHNGPVNAVAVALNKGIIVSGSSDCTLMTWDVDRGRQRRTFAGAHTARIRAVACTPDGDLALSGSADGALILWDLERGTFKVLRSTGPGIKALAILPQQPPIAVSGANDGTVALWDLKGCRIVHSWTGHRKRVDSLAATEDLVVSASSDHTLSVWKILRERPTDPVNVAGFTADAELYTCAVTQRGSVIAAGDASGATHFLALQQPPT